jgi:hypothetical protein
MNCSLVVRRYKVKRSVKSRRTMNLVKRKLIFWPKSKEASQTRGGECSVRILLFRFFLSRCYLVTGEKAVVTTRDKVV